MVVDVSYISKEHSEDATTASSGVTPGHSRCAGAAFAEHAAMLDRLGAPWKLLRAREDFDESIDRVILPGGESTTQGKLLRSTGLFEPINEHIKAGKPVFGTCAGMILLAQRLENDPNVYFGGTGRHREAQRLRSPAGFVHGHRECRHIPRRWHSGWRDRELPARVHPRSLRRRDGANARVMCEANGNTVALQQGRILATAFHPEITPDTRIHEFFLII